MLVTYHSNQYNDLYTLYVIYISISSNQKTIRDIYYLYIIYIQWSVYYLYIYILSIYYLYMAKEKQRFEAPLRSCRTSSPCPRASRSAPRRAARCHRGLVMPLRAPLFWTGVETPGKGGNTMKNGDEMVL